MATQRTPTAYQQEGVAGSIFTRFVPPFDLTSDMLIALALAPTAPLQAAFPREPILSLAGQTPLAMWFSRIKRIVYTDPSGQPRQEGSVESVLYHELNVVALLRDRAFFVPGIYATSGQTIHIGRSYGMPKYPTTMSFGASQYKVISRVSYQGSQSFASGRLVGSGRWLGELLGLLWPLRIWPARFPSGREVVPCLMATPCAQLTWIKGRLALPVPWLPRSVSLLPLGLYLPNQGMQLPPPEHGKAGEVI